METVHSNLNSSAKSKDEEVWLLNKISLLILESKSIVIDPLFFFGFLMRNVVDAALAFLAAVAKDGQCERQRSLLVPLISLVEHSLYIRSDAGWKFFFGGEGILAWLETSSSLELRTKVFMLPVCFASLNVLRVID